MFSIFHFVFVAVFIAQCTAVYYSPGDVCTLSRTGEVGRCEPLRDCVSAKEDLKRGLVPQTCSFLGIMPVVCCVANTLSPIADTVASVPNRQTPQASCRNTAAYNAAVKVRKTGKKAWDKCIDLVDSIYPCKPSSFIINAPWIRNNDCGHSATTLIVGGVTASPGEFPHMAALGFTETESPLTISWPCGGSLISDQWVLTAAHCVTLALGSSVSHVRLGGGDSNMEPPPEYLFTVIERVTHPAYRRVVKYNDIALLKLDRKVIFSRQVRPACLHSGEDINDRKALVTGWGATSNEGKLSNSLLKTTLEKFDFDDCSTSNPPIKGSFKYGVQNETQVCYGHKTLRQDTCKGDSGGPLQIYNNDRVDCTYLIFGITSNGKICGEPGFAALYTRISAYIGWIEDTVWPDN